MEKEKAPIVRTTINLPAELNQKLLDAMEKSRRSRHAEMVYALEKFFETPGGHGGEERAKRA